MFRIQIRGLKLMETEHLPEGGRSKLPRLEREEAGLEPWECQASQQ